MPLSSNEIEGLVKKLRENYEEYAKKYSPKWFDIEQFNERYLHAVRRGMNLEGFILAEISTFEKLKERYEKRKKAKENPFSKKVDQIIDENLAKIKKYPQIVFHPSCGVEIGYFYGAMKDFSYSFFPILWYLIREHHMRIELNRIEENLEFYTMPGSDKYSKRIEDHINVLNRPGIREIDIEKDRNDFLKECAFILHDVSIICGNAMEITMEEWNYPISFDRFHIEEKRKKAVISNFNDSTGYGAILRVKEKSNEIISDFRLSAFKKMG